MYNSEDTGGARTKELVQYACGMMRHVSLRKLFREKKELGGGEGGGGEKLKGVLVDGCRGVHTPKPTVRFRFPLFHNIFQSL